MAETWKWKVQLNDEEAHGGGVYCGDSIATVCKNNTGIFNFAPPSTGENNYTITYTNGTQTTTTSFTVNAGDCVKCDCDKFQFVAEEGGSIYIPASGGCEISLGKITGSTKNCQYTYQNCTISESTFGSNELSIDGYNSEKGLIGSIQQNNGRPPAKIKSAKLTVSAKDTAEDICTAKPFYLRQYASMTDNDSAMQNNDCAVHALKIDAAGTGGGNDEVFMLGNNPDINWRDYFEYKANTPFEGQSVAPTGVKDQQGTTISSFDTSAITSINEPYFADGVWHFQFDLSAHSGAKRYAVVYLHNKKFGTPGNVYQEYGWIIAGQPMRD